MYKTFCAQTVRHELRDGHERESVLLREFRESRPLGRGAVFVEGFANDAGRIEPSETAEIDGRFRVSNALQHTTGARAQRMHVTRTPQISRRRLRIDRHLNRLRLI